MKQDFTRVELMEAVRAKAHELTQGSSKYKEAFLKAVYYITSHTDTDTQEGTENYMFCIALIRAEQDMIPEIRDTFINVYTKIMQNKKHAKVIQLPSNEIVLKLQGSLRIMQKYNKAQLCKDVVIEDGCLKGNINGIWALAAFNYGERPADTITLRYTQGIKNSGIPLEDLLY